MSPTNFRVAILQNYPISAKGGELMIENISKLVLNSKPDVEIKVYAPIQGDAFPDLDNNDLIILTGGPFNLLEDEKPSWVTETLDFIKAAITDRAKPKILGICWGQQAIALALGGSMGELKTGPCIGVDTISLTSGGATFFNARSLDIHKHHKLAVIDIGPHLCCLALNNEILLSKNNQVLTFQGHPELDAILSQLLMDTDDPSSSVRPEPKTVIKAIDAPHDGEMIFATIMKWASGEITP
ncbi:class I glutamine amidotransferase-like protein [Aspergillus parasiticus]|uniref:Class I glutamine amidotransferase-like protein n=1 Tax=Aspergillus parasiticus TaxID=5067 RepID=A0A5N6E2K2_ASPPA|nr:class I glutamine amidotransferase-like protein [Aspergillus parasiticus]